MIVFATQIKINFLALVCRLWLAIYSVPICIVVASTLKPVPGSPKAFDAAAVWCFAMCIWLIRHIMFILIYFSRTAVNYSAYRPFSMTFITVNICPCGSYDYRSVHGKNKACFNVHITHPSNRMRIRALTSIESNEYVPWAAGGIRIWCTTTIKPKQERSPT